MVITVWMFGAHKPEVFNAEDRDLDVLVSEPLEHWMEDATGGQAFVFIDEDGVTLATIMRNTKDPEIAHISYADGSAVTMRCHYVLDQHGMYSHTEFRQLAAIGLRRPVRRVEA